MRVHVVKLGVLSALVAAVVAQAATSEVLRSSVPASDSSALPAATLPVPVGTTAPASTAVAVDIPDTWSFDDGHGGVFLAVPAVAASSAAGRRPVAPRKPPKPPGKARTGALPAAGTPQAVLAAAYVKAASQAPRTCHLRPVHLAAIGQVESGSVGGRRIDGAHRVTPAIYGPLLDGGPFAVVRDSDGGAYDGAGDYDRAVGPLQFLPGTWRWAGRDGDGDGRRDPQNVFDAAMATADYLCRDGRDLSHAGDLRGAILTYNWSGEYVAAVTQWVSFFSRHGLAALDDVAFRVGSGGRASDLAVAPKDKAKDKAKDKTKDKTKTTSKAEDTTKGRGPKGEPAKPGTVTPGPTTPGPGGTATPTTSTPTGTATTPAPSGTTTTPAPDPTTPAPDPTTPAPPEPAPTTPEPVVTTPTASGPSDLASASSPG